MPAMLLYFLQGAASASKPAAPPPTPLPAPPLSITLREPCGPATADDIVVCASKDIAQRYRLPPLDEARYQHPHRAETRLFGTVNGAVELEQQTLADGVISKRVMFRLKTPF